MKNKNLQRRSVFESDYVDFGYLNRGKVCEIMTKLCNSNLYKIAALKFVKFGDTRNKYRKSSNQC